MTKRIDTKNAKQGDEVNALVTSTAKLPDRTELSPEGGAATGGSTGSSAPAASSAPIVSDTGQSQSSAGGVLKSARDRVPVGNMPGVIPSGAEGPGSAGSLDAAGDNINLDSGTKLTLNVAAAGSPAGQ